jgi:pyruvate dehydrogenase E1 component alpha subunit
VAERPLQFLNPDGQLIEKSPVDLDRAVALYRDMVLARVYDKKGVALQKQGRLATYAPFEGQEAAQVASAATLEQGDWMVPSYREPAAMWMHGYPMELLIATRRGTELGGSPPDDVRVLPVSIPVGSHMLHAVGLAWAERLRGTDRVAITYFGDGATSEGDFHEAMNFAGVLNAGCIFFCQNNGWAISLPREEQTAAETIAHKAVGYGMPGVLVDGNDALAVYEATRTAVERARSGAGPTLIEAQTYRMGPHSTADDPGRYRSPDATEEWRTRDPVERLRRYLADQGSWTPEWQAELEQDGSALVEQAVVTAETLPTFRPEEMFDGMFAELPPGIAAQRAEAGAI